MTDAAEDPAPADSGADTGADERAGTRAALAPTVEAAQALLPWLARPREPRFPPEPAGRWQAAAQRLAGLWSARHTEGLDDLRPAVFSLYACTLELGDADALRLAEALASAADRLEAAGLAGLPHLAAALSATLECLAEPEHLEHPAFAERTRHFAERLERCADPAAPPPDRSPVIEKLFLADATECIERMREALAVLPPDAVAIKEAAGDLARLAEPLDQDDIRRQARDIARRMTVRAGEQVDLDAGATRAGVEAAIATLEQTLADLEK